MNSIYLDLFSGVSGDMFVGALIDLGADAAQLRAELEKLGLDGYHLHVSRKQKMGITGTKFDVHLEHSHHGDPGESHTHEHSHSHGDHHSHDAGHHHDDSHAHESGSHAHTHEHSGGHVLPKAPHAHAHEHTHVHTHDHVHDETHHHHHGEPGKSHTHEHSHSHSHRHEHEHDHDHDHGAGGALSSHGHGHGQTHDHDASHHHHAHGGPDDSTSHTHGRSYAEIRNLIQTSSLSPWVKEKALAVFHRIAVVEARIHGVPVETVGFHEVGAVDSIVDIVGACVGLELLGRPKVSSSVVIEGTGLVRCAHGNYPIPAPATLGILADRKAPLTQCPEPHELVTPTGAALIAEFSESFGPMRHFTVARIGFGLGTRDNHTRPNVLRAIQGSFSVTTPAGDWETDTVAVLETNLDDISPEILGAFVERALAKGALDVFHTPVQMKKNRPGVLLSVICAEADADKFSRLILEETSAFGVRRHLADRRKLHREFVTVDTQFGSVKVKVGKLGDRLTQAAPEFEDCKALAEKFGVPLKQVYEAANAAFRAKL